ncbi:MAG: Ig-like domain-containing protein [Nitrososphaerales archaeon]
MISKGSLDFLVKRVSLKSGAIGVRSLVLVSMAISIFMLSIFSLPLHVSASSQVTVVQETAVGCSSQCSSLSVSLSGVTLGDILVIGISSVLSSLTSVSDSLNSPLTQAVSSTLGSSEQYSYIYYASLFSSGSDSITVTFSGSGYADVYVFELAGVTTAGLQTASGSSNGFSGTSAATSNSLSFQPGAFIMSVVNNEGNYITQGSGFTRIGGPSSNSISEYATSGVSSPTDFPATWSGSFIWVESAIALEPVQISTVTTTVTSTTTSVSTETTTTTSTVTTTSIPPPVTITTTETSSTTLTSTSTVTSTQTQTSTVTTTTTETATSTLLVPSNVVLNCAPSTVQVGASTHCKADVTTADNGSLTGTIAFSSDGAGAFSNEMCNTNHATGILTCNVDYSPSAAGTQTIAATYSGNQYHTSSQGTFQLTANPLGTPHSSVIATGMSSLALGSFIALGTLFITGASVFVINAGKKKALR